MLCTLFEKKDISVCDNECLLLLKNIEKRVGNISKKEPESPEKYEYCSYCGSRLHYAFYFCTVCATPFRPISEVVAPYTPRPLTESELIKQKVPNVWRIFWSYAILIFFVALLNYALFEKDQDYAYRIILGDVLIVLTTIVFEIIFWRSLVVQFKQTGFLVPEVWLGFLLLFILVAVNLSYHWSIFMIDKSLTINLDKIDLSKWSMFILLCLIPGITEEIAFRGLIQHWLHTVLKPWRAIILTSALFMALHLSIISAPIIFLVGMLLGWIKYKSRSLYPSIIMHILYNWISITVFPIIIESR